MKVFAVTLVVCLVIVATNSIVVDKPWKVVDFNIEECYGSCSGKCKPEPFQLLKECTGFGFEDMDDIVKCVNKKIHACVVKCHSNCK